MSGQQEDWNHNYFNYFTEVEEQFQRARGTGLFLLSPLDWALIESWKNAGIPLEAVLRGIDAAMEKWRSRKQRGRKVNSVAYCTQAVVEEAQAMAGLTDAAQRREPEAPFGIEDLRAHLQGAVERLSQRGDAYQGVREALAEMLDHLEEHFERLEELEQRLSALEDKMAAVARVSQSEESLFEARRRLDLELRPYRGKMSADQLARLEKQYLDRHLFETEALPRLSLFYVR